VSAESAGLPVPAAAGHDNAGHGGVIHDIGYRQYAGVRLGRAAIAATLARQSFLTAYGFGRGGKAKVFPILLFALMCVPAVVSIAALALNPKAGQLVGYDTYQSTLRQLVLLVFIALQAPALVSGDLRYHTLPLYFSRPISRADYPLAKLAGFFLACLALIEIPLLVLWAGTISEVHGASAVWHQTTAFGAGLLYGLAWAALLAPIGLALACMTGRRVFSICAVAIPLFVTWVLAQVLSHIGLQTFQPVGRGQLPALASLAGLINPFTVMAGITDWFGSAPKVLYAPAGPGGPVGPGGPGRVRVEMLQLVGHFGPWYLAMYVLMLAAAAGALLIRYRRVAVA